MKKLFICLLLICTLYAINGCGQRNDKDLNMPMARIENDKEKNTDNIEWKKESIDAITVEEMDEIDDEKLENEKRENNDMISEWAEENEVIENLYFPYKEHISLKVHAEYYNSGFVDETVNAEINRIKIYEAGSIYKLEINIIPFTSSWIFPSDDIMSMYFYVTADKIYWILPWAVSESGGKEVRFYNDDELLVKTLDTEEKIQSNGVLELVCQGKDIHEEAFDMTQEGNKITYYYSETKVNGEPGEEHIFVWEKGKGLIEFGTGFGPGPMDVHIDGIWEVVEDE